MKPTDIVKQIADESKGNAGWDQPGDFAIMLIRPTLLIDVGSVKAGTEVTLLTIDFTTGIAEVVCVESITRAAIKVTLEPITE